MYPLKFENHYIKKPWGSRLLEKIRDNLPDELIGESWDISCHTNGMSVIANGKYKGISLEDLIKLEGKNLLGQKIDLDKFPLLIKLLSPQEKLSVQVHPDDEYSLKYEGELGKTEAWYIIHAEPGTKLILGTNGCTKDEFVESIKSNTSEEMMNRLPIKKGQVYLIKSGLLHTIEGSAIIAEIQQNSDTTYRVYDYNRGRELHIDKALDCIDFNLIGKRSNGLKVDYKGYSKTYYCLDKHFSLELYKIENELIEDSNIDRFYLYTCVNGHGEIIYKSKSMKINFGESIFIPATLGEYKIVGKLSLIKSYVPDIQKVGKEILSVIR